MDNIFMPLYCSQNSRTDSGGQEHHPTTFRYIDGIYYFETSSNFGHTTNKSFHFIKAKKNMMAKLLLVMKIELYLKCRCWQRGRRSPKVPSLMNVLQRIILKFVREWKFWSEDLKEPNVSFRRRMLNCYRAFWWKLHLQTVLNFEGCVTVDTVRSVMNSTKFKSNPGRNDG